MLATVDLDFLQDYLDQSAGAVDVFRSDQAYAGLLTSMTEALVTSLRHGGKLLIAGNGGSAGDAQHLAGEFSGRMLYDRPPLPAVALHCDTSALTAIGNDYGFEQIYERQVLALGRPGDVFWALSTSGNSSNVVRALRAARTQGVVTIGFTGAGGGEMAGLCDMLLKAPSTFTPVIQQVHMVAGHILCALVERAIFPR
jgi:D-sedoheptulose 7-phosphate isomerase